MLFRSISVPKSLLYYRLHSNSVTAKKRESIENKKNLILKKYLYFESIEVNLNHLEIWNRYKLVPEPHLRQLLFIFDYLNFLKLKNENQKYVKIILTYFLRVIFCPIKLYYVYRLLKEKSLRNNYRLNYK